MTILCLNAGSSSLKLAVFDGALTELYRSQIDNPGRAAPTLPDKGLPDSADLIVHRFVHGGRELDRPTLVDDVIHEKLRALALLAPLHMPFALELLAATHRRFPRAKQIACFDTAFHTTVPEHAFRYPLPKTLCGDDIRRYGFHGLSCEHVVASLDPLRLERCVIAHLGNGCSVTAVRNGKSVDTSMGFSPLGGVVMGTRPGDLDPGLITFLMHNGAREAREVSCDDTAEAETRRSLLFAVSLDGTRGFMRASGPIDSMLQLCKTLEIRTDAIGLDPETGMYPLYREAMFDSLMQIFAAVESAPAGSSVDPDRATLVVETTLHDLATGGGDLEGKVRVCAETLARLGCDARIQTVHVDEDGNIGPRPDDTDDPALVVATPQKPRSGLSLPRVWSHLVGPRPPHQGMGRRRRPHRPRQPHHALRTTPQVSARGSLAYRGPSRRVGRFRQTGWSKVCRGAAAPARRRP